VPAHTNLERHVLRRRPQGVQRDLRAPLVRKSFLPVDETLGGTPAGLGESEGGFDDFELETAFVAVEHDAVTFPGLSEGALASVSRGGGRGGMEQNQRGCRDGEIWEEREEERFLR